MLSFDINVVKRVTFEPNYILQNVEYIIIHAQFSRKLESEDKITR